MGVSTVKNTSSAAESGSFVRKTRGYSVVQNEALFNGIPFVPQKFRNFPAIFEHRKIQANPL